MKIYLVGFMGAGKTTIGWELAPRLEAPFFDLDELVEAAEKMSVKDPKSISVCLKLSSAIYRSERRIRRRQAMCMYEARITR